MAAMSDPTAMTPSDCAIKITMSRKLKRDAR